ncbi:MAG: pyruvate kinase, partial [Planctomycetaceae bacterium]|nr:pyruvate kinase [Planctomycetaceae bacterium]
MEPQPTTLRRERSEGVLVNTKIVATVGPASQSPEVLGALMHAGADVFRLNFAHGSHESHAKIIQTIRAAAQEQGRVVGILGDLSGPKIRLGELAPDGVRCRFGERFEFVRTATPGRDDQLTCTYEQLIDDLQPGDRVLLADGVVSMRVVEADPAAGRVVCEVVQPGTIRSRQGVNLPGVALSTPAITEKDAQDLQFALDQGIDFIGLSFVRSAADIRDLHKRIADHGTKTPPWIVAKIEKTEAIDDLEAILAETDAVMVARGDLGVESDIARVPSLQKRIIRLCNERRLPVITATQMLDSMQRSELPTRAEVSDVANAILDGTDAVMLSGETAIGEYPVAAVSMMSRIAQDAERLLTPRIDGDNQAQIRSRATAITEAVTMGAVAAARHLGADLIAVATRGGKTALAVSKQRYGVPILALTDRPEIARRLALLWGVLPVPTDAVARSPREFLTYVQDLGRKLDLLRSGSKLVVVGSSDWSTEWHDMVLAHV